MHPPHGGEKSASVATRGQPPNQNMVKASSLGPDGLQQMQTKAIEYYQPTSSTFTAANRHHYDDDNIFTKVRDQQSSLHLQIVNAPHNFQHATLFELLPTMNVVPSISTSTTLGGGSQDV